MEDKKLANDVWITQWCSPVMSCVIEVRVFKTLMKEGNNSAPGRWEDMGLANWGWWLWSRAFNRNHTFKYRAIGLSWFILIHPLRHVTKVSTHFRCLIEGVCAVTWTVSKIFQVVLDFVMQAGSSRNLQGSVAVKPALPYTDARLQKYWEHMKLNSLQVKWFLILHHVVKHGSVNHRRIAVGRKDGRSPTKMEWVSHWMIHQQKFQKKWKWGSLSLWMLLLQVPKIEEEDRQWTCMIMYDSCMYV